MYRRWLLLLVLILSTYWGYWFWQYRHLKLPDHLLIKAKADAEKYKHRIKRKRYLTIVDFSKPFFSTRLWIYDTELDRVVLQSRVSHAFRTGLWSGVSFSNEIGSKKSSIGPYCTAEPYKGRFGYSMRLDGLDPKNNNARVRAVVMHPDPGVFFSDGCFMLPPEADRKAIDLIKGGSLLCAYK